MRDSEIRVQQIVETRFLFKHPMHVNVLYIWPFLPSTNHAKCLLQSPLPGSSEGDDHGRTNCQLACVSQKGFCSSFHAPTYLWNSVLKTKPIFKAVTIFSFTALNFSWGGEILAKSRISSVRIIILAYSLLSFFSWGFIRGIQGG